MCSNHNESLFVDTLKHPLIENKQAEFLGWVCKAFSKRDFGQFPPETTKKKGIKSNTLKVEKSNSDAGVKRFLEHETRSNTPSFTIYGINISLSELKGNYIENLCRNIITGIEIISLIFLA